MDFLALITSGIEKAGSLTALAKALDLTQPKLSEIKAGRAPLPDRSVALLANYLNIRVGDVFVSSRFFYAKTAEEKELYRPFVEHARAAMIAVTSGLVISFVTPTSAEASPSIESRNPTMYIM